MGDELRWQSWIFDKFKLILDRIDRELHSLKHLELKSHGLSSEYVDFFDNISVRILLGELFRVFRFLKRLFMP